MKSRRGEEPPAHVPMCILPEGAHIAVTVNQQLPSERQDDPPELRYHAYRDLAGGRK
jgi:hypothetical protein